MRRTIVLAVLLAAARAGAEPLADARAAYAGGELDGAVIASAGYLQPLADRFAGSVDVAWAVGNADVHDNRVRAGVRMDVWRSGRFRIRGALRVARRATANAGFAAQTFGTELQVSPGLTCGRWAGQVDLGVEQGWLAQITTTETYRELVYRSAADGWYAATARALRLGLAGSMSVGHVEVTARVGWAHHGAIDVLPPVYAEIAVAVGF